MKLLICPSLATTEKYSVILLKEIGGCPCKLRRICEDTGVHAKLRGWIVSKPILKTKMVTRQRRRAYKTAREVHGTKRRVSKSEEFSEEVLKKRILYGQNSWLRKREASKAEASSSSNDMSAPPDHALTLPLAGANILTRILPLQESLHESSGMPGCGGPEGPNLIKKLLRSRQVIPEQTPDSVKSLTGVLISKSVTAI